MNEISVIENLSDNAILKEIGNFIQQKRISKGITQQDFAARVAISRSTLSLVERGEGIALGNLIKILRMLDALYVLNDFIVQYQISPMLLAKGVSEPRQRAYSKSKKNTKDDLGW